MVRKRYGYVRVLEGRYIESMTNLITIKVGQGLQIVDFEMYDMKLEKVGYIDRKIKHSAMIKYLIRYLASKDYLEITQGMTLSPVIATTVKKGKEAYILRPYGSDTCIVPAMYFSTSDSFGDGSAIGRGFPLPEDASMVDSVSKDDEIVYECNTGSRSPKSIVENAPEIVCKNGSILIPFNASSEKLTAAVYTLLGRQVLSGSFVNARNTATFSLPLSNLPSGRYICMVRYHSKKKVTNGFLLSTNVR